MTETGRRQRRKTGDALSDQKDFAFFAIIGLMDTRLARSSQLGQLILRPFVQRDFFR